MPADGTLGTSLVFSSDSAEVPCGSWAAFKIARYLMGYTGAARYGDWIERLIYNGIGAALPVQLDGTAFYYSDYRLDIATKGYYGEKWPCCSGTYIQAVADYHNVIYFKDAKGLYVNLAIPSEATWEHDGQQVTLRQNTQFPESDESQFKISAPRPVTFALRVRVPAWCSSCTFRINGEQASVSAKAQEWAVIERTWNPGDTVVVKFPMSLSLDAVDVQHPRRAAIKYGPVVLAQGQPLFSVPLELRGDDPASRLERETDDLHFRVKYETPPQAEPGLFRPYYQFQKDERYRMYFDLDAPLEYG
jgi:hypothetical protein